MYMAAQLCQSDRSETIVMQSKRIYGLEPDGFNGAQADSKPQRCTVQEFTIYKIFDSLTYCFQYFFVLFPFIIDTHHIVTSHIMLQDLTSSGVYDSNNVPARLCYTSSHTYLLSSDVV